MRLIAGIFYLEMIQLKAKVFLPRFMTIFKISGFL